MGYALPMPADHYVLVAERRGLPPSKRHREVIYATVNEAQAHQDAKAMARENKGMRYYVMPYEAAHEVAEDEIHELEHALYEAKQMGR